MPIVVLLSTFNGARFLRAQLESLLSQTREIRLLVRDDGSKDGTAAILDEYAARGALTWFPGENLGPGRSFRALLECAPAAELYAFCDQDDVWDADKLESAARALSQAKPDEPTLYCSDVRLTDAALRPLSGRCVRPEAAAFPCALLYNAAPGCTFVFNRALYEALTRIPAPSPLWANHDWTTLQTAACLGRVLFDPGRHMCYRQHGANAVGAPRRSYASTARKLWSFWAGEMRNSRSARAYRLLSALGEAMCPEVRRLVDGMARYRDDPALRRALLKGAGTWYSPGTAALVHLLIRTNRL